MFMSSVCIARPRGRIEDQIDNVLAIQLPNLLTAERRKSLADERTTEVRNSDCMPPFRHCRDRGSPLSQLLTVAFSAT